MNRDFFKANPMSVSDLADWCVLPLLITVRDIGKLPEFDRALDVDREEDQL